MIEANIYDEQIALVSEYAADGLLLDWLRRHSSKAPSVAQAIEMMSGILAGLEPLHRRNILHRDLKPANILLQGDFPHLADFGLCLDIVQYAKYNESRHVGLYFTRSLHSRTSLANRHLGSGCDSLSTANGTLIISATGRRFVDGGNPDQTTGVVATICTRAVVCSLKQHTVWLIEPSPHVGSTHKTQIRARKPANIGKHRYQITAIHTKPTCQRRCILIGRNGGNPSAVTGVIRAIDL